MSQVITAEGVRSRIREAWDTLRRVPAARVPGFKTAWPDVVQSYWEAYSNESSAPRLPPAEPRAIDRMHEAFTWFRFVGDRDLAQALWLTCGCGMGPRRAGAVLGVSRWSIARWRDEALQRIVVGILQADSCNRFGGGATSALAR